jgi:hypothetical protein
MPRLTKLGEELQILLARCASDHQGYGEAVACWNFYVAVRVLTDPDWRELYGPLDLSRPGGRWNPLTEADKEALRERAREARALEAEEAGKPAPVEDDAHAGVDPGPGAIPGSGAARMVGRDDPATQQADRVEEATLSGKTPPARPGRTSTKE